MKAHAIQIAKTLGVVLVGIYVLRRVPVIGGYVDTAING